MAAGREITERVGRLLAAARARANLRQSQVAERAGTSQQWVSRVERGEVNLRLRDADRLFFAVGSRLVVQTGRPSDADAADPDLLTEAEAMPELEGVVAAHAYVWRRFADVPHVLGGRLAALAQGFAVRPANIDMIIPEVAVPAADAAMSWMNALRWSDVHQDWTGYDFTVSGAGPRRWRLRTGFELRIDVVPELPAALVVAAGDTALTVVPLVRLVDDDADIAELAELAGLRRRG